MASHSNALAWKIPWTEESGGLQSMGSWGCWELDRTEWLHFCFSLSCIGEGNGNPLQCSCLENPRDGGAWWAAVYGVTQSWTRLKWLSSNSEECSYMPGNVWREDSSVLSLMSLFSLFKQNSMLLRGTEVIVWGRLGSPLVNILFMTKLLSLIPLSCDMDCVLTLWLTLPLVPLVTVAVCLVFWSLSFPKEVSCTTAYIYS